ncbi:MAG: glycosyltransferase family 4 protein, partial [Deltaproteobacteria bacterium]|nr:glycosyltransferase family 4 protein [Deltaproteobacteria bacterium]
RRPSPVVFPVSNLVREEMLKSYEIPEARIKVIHPGVLPERFSGFDRSACRHEIRTRHGLLSGDIVILFVGLNYKVKRLDLVFEGMAELLRRGNAGNSAKLLIVGKKPSHRFLSLARTLGIADRCFFAGVTREIEKYYFASDIFIMPSSYDTFGMVVLEAMMAGLPVIITEKVGAKDLIRSGTQGFVLGDRPSPMDIADRLAILLKRENRLSMGREARRTASEHGWEKKGRLLAEMYRSLSGCSRQEVPLAEWNPQTV